MSTAREPSLRSAQPRKTVLVIVGMPGAGKSLASSVMKTRGIPVFVSGDIIRAEARKRKLKFTRKNLGELMLKIRREEGMGAVAKRLVHSLRRQEESLSSMRVLEVLRRLMSFVGSMMLLRSLFTLLPRHDSRGCSADGGRTDPEDWLTSRSGTIASSALGLRSLLRWRIGRLRMRIAKMISRGELDDYSKWS